MPVLLTGRVIEVGERSLLWAIDDDPDKTIHIPLSVCENADHIQDDDTEIEVRTWWHQHNADVFDPEWDGGGAN